MCNDRPVDKHDSVPTCEISSCDLIDCINTVCRRRKAAETQMQDEPCLDVYSEISDSYVANSMGDDQDMLINECFSNMQNEINSPRNKSVSTTALRTAECAVKHQDDDDATAEPCRQYGESKGIDWEDPCVKQLIEDYLCKKIKSLELLCWRIFEATAIPVSKMTLSRRLNGRSYHLDQLLSSRSSAQCSSSTNSNSDGVSTKRARTDRQNAVQSKSEQSNTSDETAICAPRIMKGSDVLLQRELKPFVEGKVKSLHTVRTNVRQLTGVIVPISVLRSKLYSLSPKKQNVRCDEGECSHSEGCDQSTKIAGPSHQEDDSCDNAQSHAGMLYDLVSDVPSLGGMSRCLQSTVLTIPEGDGTVRQYKQNKTGREKDLVQYFRCSGCSSIHRRMHTNVLPKIRMKLGEIVGNRFPEHHPLCKPITRAQAYIKEIDRCCRRDIRLGIKGPRDAWNWGRCRAIKDCEMLREMSGGSLHPVDDVATAFPPWRKLRTQYHRISAQAPSCADEQLYEYDDTIQDTEEDGQVFNTDEYEECNDTCPSLDEMASQSYNRTSSFNRTYEKRVIEETPRVVMTGTMRLPQMQPSGQIQSSAMNAPLGSPATSMPAHQTSDDSFLASIDVSQFKPEDLKVAVIGQFIVVEANHPEREDELGFVERHFTRKFRLPRNVPAETVTSNLTADGQLSVSAVAPKPKEDGGARTIPIKMIPKAEGSSMS